jgi:hypothetical protein
LTNDSNQNGKKRTIGKRNLPWIRDCTGALFLIALKPGINVPRNIK